VGIEVPNKKPEIVSMRSLITSKAFQESKFDIALALGRTITNDPYIVDLTKMPHLLIAGATGQGKSVGINAIITSILYKKHPAEIKLVLIDPKRVELPLYTKIERHFLAKLPGEEDAIITDTQKVINTLYSLCIEMDNRLELLKEAQVRNIKEYNEKFISRKLNPEKGHKYLPYIVLIIDEFADLIMTAGREIEGPIGRLAQVSRAIGIHLIISTQRPSTNIITGFIKANFPTRIAFRVFSSIDSRTILDTTGADRLVGRGDMLISSGSEPVRLQCAFIDTPEIEELTEYIGSQQGYADAMHLPEYIDDSEAGVIEVDLKKRDPMFEEAARLVVQHQQGSTSLIQRKLSIGYNRAGRIIDQLEAAGIVGPFEGSKARDVLCSDLMILEQILERLD
jgi:S-DNA-T family DNA segregation ATPase FtsK/SpoIIIE